MAKKETSIPLKDLYTINTQYQNFAFLSPILYPMQNRVLNKNKREKETKKMKTSKRNIKKNEIRIKCMWKA